MLKGDARRGAIGPYPTPTDPAGRRYPEKSKTRSAENAIDYLEESEMQAELTAVDVNTRTGVRDQALLMVLYNTGARVSEIVNLRLADLRLDTASQITLHGKGNKDRTCPLWPETVAALKAYLERRTPKAPGTTHVFLNANGAPITRFGIRYVTRKYGFKAGTEHPAIQQKPVNPHRIRHTTAMHLLRAGNDLNMVSYWLGHADLNTTHIYVEIDMDAKRKMLDKTSAPTISKTASWHRPSVLQWLRDLAREPELCQANSRPTKDRSRREAQNDCPLHIIGRCT